MAAAAQLFENPRVEVDEWTGMPEFSQENLAPVQSLKVHFASDADREAFARLVGQTVTNRTRSIWYPQAEIGRMVTKMFSTDQPLNPRHPVYVISKGRWDSRLTSKSLEQMGVPYQIVVEPQEFDAYAAVIDPRKIIALPFSNLGQGSIPARNFVWEHAIASGATRHWILDDNIDGFFRLYKNLKTPAGCGNIFRAAEDFVERYENVALAGFNYFMFASRKTVMPPFVRNTRIYSCILIQNDLPYRWRGRYNEDTDLSLRALKDGRCTMLFNAFLIGKQTTMTMKGGNTDELYAGDGRLEMAEALRAAHPDVTTVVEKWGRWQHHVDYRAFRANKLVRKPDVAVADGHNEYGMRLVALSESYKRLASMLLAAETSIDAGEDADVERAAKDAIVETIAEALTVDPVAVETVTAAIDGQPPAVVAAAIVEATDRGNKKRRQREAAPSLFDAFDATEATP